MIAFILGCPRSGTYLLCTMLDSHLPVAVPVEPQFIPIFRPFLPLWGDLKQEKNRRKLLRAIFGFLKIWTPRSERGKDWVKVKAHSLLSVEDQSSAIVNAPRAQAGTYDGLVEALFDAFARSKGKKFSIDKSAFYRFVPPELMIDSQDSPARFVHIVRDGRDVAISWMRSWFGPTTVAEAASEWVRHVRDGREWGKRNPDRYLELRYEDLIADVDGNLARIAAFLGVEFKGFSDEVHKNSPLVAALQGEGGDHALIAGGIQAGNRDKWRKQLNRSDLRLFEHIAGPALREFGYELGEPAPAGAAEKLSFAARIAYSQVARVLSVRRWKRIVKKFLPLALYFWSH